MPSNYQWQRRFHLLLLRWTSLSATGTVVKIRTRKMARTADDEDSVDAAAAVDGDAPVHWRPCAVDVAWRPIKMGQIQDLSLMQCPSMSQQRPLQLQKPRTRPSRRQHERPWLRMLHCHSLSLSLTVPFVIRTRSNWCHGVAWCCAGPTTRTMTTTTTAGGGCGYDSDCCCCCSSCGCGVAS